MCVCVLTTVSVLLLSLYTLYLIQSMRVDECRRF